MSETDDSSSEVTLKWPVNECVEFIKREKLNCVALQFADQDLGDCFALSSKIEEECSSQLGRSVQTYVMADSSFAPCCVDFVTAQRISEVDGVIHFSVHCHSSSPSEGSSLPVFHVVPQSLSLDVSHLRSSLLTTHVDYSEDSSAYFLPKRITRTVFVLFEQRFSRAEPSLCRMLDELNELPSNRDTRYVLGSQLMNKDNSTDHSVSDMAVVLSSLTLTNVCGFQFPSKIIEDYLDHPSDFEVLIIAEDEAVCNSECDNSSADYRFAQTILWNFSQCSRSLIYSAKSRCLSEMNPLPVRRLVMSRFAAIEQCKEAEVIGIVLCTAVNESSIRTVSHLTRLLTRVNQSSSDTDIISKAWYLIWSSKPTPSKLANFTEVDVFVLVCCPLSWAQLCQQRDDYFAPIVSAFECDLALNPDSRWTGHYSTHLPRAALSDSCSLNDDDEGKKEDGTDSSALLSLVHSPGFQLAESKAARVLAKSSFKGVPLAEDSLEAAPLEEGLSGIAALYTDETVGS